MQIKLQASTSYLYVYTSLNGLWQYWLKSVLTSPLLLAPYTRRLNSEITTIVKSEEDAGENGHPEVTESYPECILNHCAVIEKKEEQEEIVTNGWSGLDFSPTENR